MRVVTFYSYKGGVGRTLALLNVAASLVARGNRVLIVDFDLEAPGFDKALGLSFRPCRGMVELITDYLRDGQVPSVENYVSPARFRDPSDAGRVGDPGPDDTPICLEPLLVLPAGLRESENEYKERLQRINFRDLYREREGYVFFDDVRQQFGKALARDYVLIDSRTGHTDVGRICTQQLPDHVIGLLVPNEQNLAGIRQEVADIRERHELCDIDLVLSRVPRLDDLEGQLREFEDRVRKETKVRRVLRVHAAESLALLKDEIYCASGYFNRAQLTEDYERIVKTILVRNIRSRDAVLYALEGGVARVGVTVGTKLAGEWLKAVLSSHPNDEKVLDALKSALRGPEYAQLRREAGDRFAFVSQSGEAARATDRARSAELSGDVEIAITQALHALQRRRELGSSLVIDCFARLCRLAPDEADRFVREAGADSIGGLLGTEDIVRFERELLSTSGGAEAVLCALTLGNHYEPLLGNPYEVREPTRMVIAERLRGPALIASVALGRPSDWTARDCVREYGSGEPACYKGLAREGRWMSRYARGDALGDGGFADGEARSRRPAQPLFPLDPPYDPPIKVRKRSDDPSSDRVNASPNAIESFEQKGFAAVRRALSGDLGPARLLMNEISEGLALEHASPTELVGNCWRMLYTPLRDLQADLMDIVAAFERASSRKAPASGKDLPRLAPPLGLRRGQTRR